MLLFSAMISSVLNTDVLITDDLKNVLLIYTDYYLQRFNKACIQTSWLSYFVFNLYNMRGQVSALFDCVDILYCL